MPTFDLFPFSRRASRFAFCLGVGLIGFSFVFTPSGQVPLGSKLQAQEAAKETKADDPLADEPLQIPMRIARRASPLGHYLAARHAELINENSVAADLLAVTSSRFPTAVGLQDARLALLSAEGRIDEARLLADRVLRDRENDRVASRVKFYSLVRKDRWRQAENIIKDLEAQDVDQVLLPLARAWAATSRKDMSDADEQIDILERFQGLDALVNLQRGMAYDVRGDVVTAAKHYEKTLEAVATATLRVTDIIGNFYERSGNTLRAREIYNEFLSLNPEEPLVKRALERIDSGEKPKALLANERQGLAEILYHLGGVLFADRGDITSSSLGNTAVYLDPENDFYRLQAGRMFEDQDRHKDAARMYAGVSPKSPLFVRSQLLHADLLLNQEQWAEAETVLQQLKTIEGQRLTAMSKLADMHRYKQDYAEAAQAYDEVLDELETQDKLDWTVLYYAGISNEQSDNWARAEALFQSALELEPDQPLILNYLAYSWVDKGLNLDQSLDMLKTAVDKRPEDGYIVDSLGWVYYRLGEFEKAVPHLERAVALRPSDAIINDHLGDAYFRVGRKKEASFQWRLSLSFKPKDDLRKQLLDKIKNGLPEVEALPETEEVVQEVGKGKSI